MNLEGTKLCPNCARQGQIFPNISKRNQKRRQNYPKIQHIKNTRDLEF